MIKKTTQWLTSLLIALPLSAQPFDVPPVPPYFQELASRAKTNLNAVLELDRELRRASGRCRAMAVDWYDFETTIQRKLQQMREQGQINDPELMYQLASFRSLREGMMNEDWLKMAADRGHPLAMLDYAGRVHSNYNPQLRAAGEALYEKAAPKVLEAAKAGDRRILFALTRGDLEVLKFPPPYNSGMYWYQKLIETKDRIAYKSMAELARYVVNSEDYAKSFAMAQEAAEAGEWEAMVYLAERYKYGQGVTADPVKAKYWMDKVVEVTGCEQALDHLDDEADDSGILDEQLAVHAGNQPPKAKTEAKKQSVKVKKGTLQKTRKSTTAIKELKQTPTVQKGADPIPQTPASKK